MHQQHALPATPILLFYELARISVWEFTGRFIPGTACAFPGSRGFRCRQVYGMECGLAGGAEWRPGLQGTDLDEHSVSYLSTT